MDCLKAPLLTDEAAAELEMIDLCQTLITGRAPLPASNQQQLQLKLLLIRLLAGAEKVANSVLFPCKYASSGCEVTLPQTDKREHEELCDFRPYSCPYPATSCRWQGSLDAVMPHLVQKHKSIPTLQGEDVVILTIDINMPGEIFWLMMQSCFGFHFMLVLQKRRKYGGSHQFFAIVQLIGTEKQAEKFGYRLELNKPQHRLTWEARPCSIHENIASAIMNDGCLIFDTFVAHLFAQNGNLDIKVTLFENV
ncbi:E3 ubiquitin-protein ligase Siah1-like [Scomber scombrus]|uniref:E3 ubiquitin-protein ligase Siah1-like n=1 Tax=Scomber scombrus TaxID=13677 RepID=UPI002DDACCC9|nr:E3 ubiquitin-protein ligase Siah1-like [Scomber scombrus]